MGHGERVLDVEIQEKSLKWKKIHIRQGTLFFKQGSLHCKQMEIKFTGVVGHCGKVPDVGFHEKNPSTEDEILPTKYLLRRLKCTSL